MLIKRNDPYVILQGQYSEKFGVPVPARESYFGSDLTSGSGGDNIRESIKYGIKFEEEDRDVEYMLFALCGD